MRIPASMCGLVGWKPTIGAVGRDGAPRWIDFSTWGATGHTVADVVAEASVYLGPTAGDVRSLPKGAVDMTLTKPSKVLLCRTLRLAVEPNIEAATRGIASMLEGLGYRVEEIENPAPGAAIDWGIISVAELSQSLVHLRDRWGELDLGLQEMLLMNEFLSLHDYVGARRRCYDVCATYDRLLGDDTVLITPVGERRVVGARRPAADHRRRHHRPGASA